MENQSKASSKPSHNTTESKPRARKTARESSVSKSKSKGRENKINESIGSKSSIPMTNEVLRNRLPAHPKKNKLKQLDPKLYEVNMKDVKKKYQEISRPKKDLINNSFSHSNKSLGKPSLLSLSTEKLRTDIKILPPNILNDDPTKLESSDKEQTIKTTENIEVVALQFDSKQNSVTSKSNKMMIFDNMPEDNQSKIEEKFESGNYTKLSKQNILNQKAGSSSSNTISKSRNNSKSSEKDNLKSSNFHNRRKYNSKIATVKNMQQLKSNNLSSSFTKEASEYPPIGKNKNQYLKQIRDRQQIEENNFENENDVSEEKSMEQGIDNQTNYKGQNNIYIADRTNAVSSIDKVQAIPTNNNEKVEAQLKIDIRRSKCAYCLKTMNKPILLKCGHFMCLSCGVEIKTVSEFMKEERVNYLKCLECNLKTFLDIDISPGSEGHCNIDVIEKDIFSNLGIKNYEDEKTNPTIQLNTCEICPSSKEVKGSAEYECLNCDVILCYECKIRHLTNPRHTDHKVMQTNNQYQERTESTLCEIHKEPLKLFCITEKKPCCLVCTNYDNLHGNHEVKSIKFIIDNAQVEFGLLIREGEPKSRYIEHYTSDLLKIRQRLSEEYAFFKNKLANSIDNIISLIRKKQLDIEDQLERTFTNKIYELTKKINAFSVITQKFSYLKNHHTDKDIDILKKITRITYINRKMQLLEQKDIIIMNKYNSKPAQLENATVNLNDNNSLKPSVFINDPFEKIRKHLNKFMFLPISNWHIKCLQEIFKESTTVSQALITPELCSILPRIRSGILLYRPSRDGYSPENFHRLCDSKGPTLILVKTSDNYVFGGYNPLSWINENMYNETEDAFIFSVSDGKYRRPLKCPVKKAKKNFAIKQNIQEYSPGFGETNDADLFIAFKNINNSYSYLGNTYSCPEGYNPAEFLAGRSTKWEITDVEVYAVEIVPDEEYFNFLKV